MVSGYFQKKEVGLHMLMPEHPILLPEDLPGLQGKIKDLTAYKLVQIIRLIGVIYISSLESRLLPSTSKVVVKCN